jgi:hypothetical protein
MRAALQTFLAGIAELEGYLTDAANEEVLLGLLLAHIETLEPTEGQLLAKLPGTATVRRRYVYAVAIVSLYGLLERFVDTLIERFVDRIASFASTYGDLPEVIRRNHISFSVDLARAIIDDRYRGASMRDEVIANLHSCLSGDLPFQLNGSAFVLHRGNITLARITQFLSSVGVDGHLRKTTRSGEFSRFLSGIYPGRDIRAIPDQELPRVFFTIDDLVERRNEVSHGVLNVDEIESIELLKERCRFIANYGLGLYEIVAQDIVAQEITSAVAQNLGAPVAVFDGSIVCFRSASCKVKLGDVLVAATGDRELPFRFGMIESIEINRIRYETVVLSEPTEFGMKVPFRARDRFSYYILPSGVI